MDKINIKNVFKEYLNVIDEKILLKMANYLELDKYVKKLDTNVFTKLFIYAELMEIPSLTEISLHLNHQPLLQNELGLKSISTSQLSRKLRDIPPTIFDALLRHLIQKIRQTYGYQKGNKMLEKLYIIDSSTITLGLSQHPWAPKNRFTGGVKMHTRVVYENDVTYPDRLIVTAARPADRTQLDSLIVNEAGALHVFDRGYYDFKKFEQLMEQDIRFVTRIKENAIVHVVEEIPVEANSMIQREAIVYLGKMQYPLRLIQVVDTAGTPIEIVMNDANISAEEISEIYRNRWKIELFFKWMKQHTVLKNSFGTSYNAVHNQIYIAMISFCLTLLIKHKTQYQGTLLQIKRLLSHYCFVDIQNFLTVLAARPKRRSKGRKRTNHEQIFKEIEIYFALLNTRTQLL